MSFENGQYKRIISKWQGGAIKSQGAVDTMVLSMGQLFIAFMFIICSTFISLICFLIECLHFKISNPT